jgi:Tfp pilus assembly protein PilF
MDLGVMLGVLILAGLGYLAIRSLRSTNPKPHVALAILWFFITVLPVSNLLFPTGVLLAERTLYLPSVGLSLIIPVVAEPLATLRRHSRRAVAAVVVVVLGGLLVRTVTRNPAWASTLVVLETLNREHPESHLAFLNRGLSRERSGDLEAAKEELRMALRLAPERYGTLTAVAGFMGRLEEWEEGERLLERAIAIAPSRDDAYRLLAGQYLRQGRGREAHRVALAGLANASAHPDLWGRVSESYVLKGDLEAALRARRVALAADSSSAQEWMRLADLLEALGRTGEAEAARRRALAIQNPMGVGSESSESRIEAPAPGQGEGEGTTR